MLYCEARVTDPMRQKNLMQCIAILGGKPEQRGDIISVEYDADTASKAKMISLFEQFLDHTIAEQTRLPL